MGICETTPSTCLLHTALRKSLPTAIRPFFSLESVIIVKMDRTSASQCRDKTYVFLWTGRQFQVE